MMDYGLTERLQFLQILEEDRSLMREFWSIAQNALPKILHDFYSHLASQPDLMKLFGSDDAKRRATVEHARTAQSKHWQYLFSGVLDAQYLTSVRRIGLTHSRIGLEPRWYIGGYGFTLNRLHKMIAGHFGSRFNIAAAQAKTGAMLAAVNKAVMLDMDIAISVYIEENKAQYDKRLGDLAANFEATVKDLAASVSQSAASVKAGASQMARIAAETSSRATSVAAASEQASVNVQAVAGASEQLTASGREIGVQMERAAQFAEQAVGDAQKSNIVIEELTQAAQKVSEIVSLINDIANRTNLLALNATIEAARAGETGKGFAVVAGEVKNLAGQTAKATDDITQQINSIQQVTSSTIEVMRRISETIVNIREASTGVAAAIQEQIAATDDISRNIQQASEGTGEISSVIVGVTQAAQNTDLDANRMMSEADALSDRSAMLQKEVETFLNRLRAA